MKREEILKKYVEFAKKLGKLPSLRDTEKLICSSRQIENEFEKFSMLKEAALHEHPYLKELNTPAALTQVDIDDARLNSFKTGTKKANKEMVSQVSTLDYLAKFAENVFKGKVTPNSVPKRKKGSTRAINLVLSDLHFGADIKSIETGHLDYGRVEEARRFATIVEQTVLYKPQYRDVTQLHVWLLGDIIQNALHDPQDAVPMAEQICRAIHLLSQGLAHLAESFPQVTVHCSTGNHGRSMSRHHNRATSGKWDSHETIIYYALKTALTKFKNLTFDIPKTPFVTADVLGHKIFATHGDTVLAVGNPGKSLNIGAIENRLNKINATLKDDEEYNVAIVGHTHVSSNSLLTNGTALITNGALCPIDQFCTSIGILEGHSSQTLFETVPEHAVGDLRIIRVGIKEDKDKTLDKLIKPWSDFND